MLSLGQIRANSFQVPKGWVMDYYDMDFQEVWIMDMGDYECLLDQLEWEEYDK